MVLVVLVAGLAAVRPAAAADAFIGTGPEGSTEHLVGRALCTIVNRATDLTCEARVTTGAISNLRNVQAGALEFGLAPSSTLYEAASGTGRFEFMDVPFDDLRMLFSLYGQTLTVVARKDAGIDVLGDVRGRRVNIGSPGSAERSATELLLAAEGVAKPDLGHAEELPPTQQSLAFCHGRIEAMTYIATHPDPAIARVLELCDGKLIDVAGPGVERLLAERPDMAVITIPAGTYETQAVDVSTVGARLAVFTSTLVDAETVQTFVQAVFGKIGPLSAMHRSLRSLDAAVMAAGTQPAPVHEDAAQFFKAHDLAQ